MWMGSNLLFVINTTLRNNKNPVKAEPRRDFLFYVFAHSGIQDHLLRS